MLNVTSYLCCDHSATILGKLPAEELEFTKQTEGRMKGLKIAWDYLNGLAETRSSDEGGYDIPCKWGAKLPTEPGEYPCLIHFPKSVEAGTLVLFVCDGICSPRMYGYYCLNDDVHGLAHARKCAAQKTVYAN